MHDTCKFFLTGALICSQWGNGHLLLVFPAGSPDFPQPRLKYVA
jgi:hypothetical protein